MTLQNFKSKIVNRFDKAVKDIANRAIPIAKEETAKLVKKSSAELLNQALGVVYVGAVGLTLASVFLSTGASAASESALSGVQSVYITIDNLSITLS